MKQREFDTSDLGFAYFDMSEADYHQVDLDLVSLPFFSDEKVVILDYFADLTTDKKRYLTDDELKQFEAYLENPVETTRLIILAPGKLDSKRRLVKLLKRDGLVLEANPLKEMELKNKSEELMLESERQMIAKAKEAEERAVKREQEKSELRKQEFEQMIEERNKMIEDLKNRENELKGREQEIRKKAEEVQIETEKQFSEKAKEIEERAIRLEREKNEMKQREYDKKLEDQKKLIDELKKKAELGSQQLQGEVQELALEEFLTSNFPIDIINEVKKGERGADAVHIVRNNLLQECGKIIYESKRTKAFSDSWIEKLKEDQKIQQADIAVIVTETMPKDMDRFGLRQGVWVCSFNEIKGLSIVLREMLIKTQSVRIVQENKGEKKDTSVIFEFFAFFNQFVVFLAQFVVLGDQFGGDKVSFELAHEVVAVAVRRRVRERDRGDPALDGEGRERGGGAGLLGAGRARHAGLSRGAGPCWPGAGGEDSRP